LFGRYLMYSVRWIEVVGRNLELKKTELISQCLLYTDDVKMLGECVHTVPAG